MLALAERRELKMDYRAAAAAAYLGLGATWAMGLSSSAAQLQANAGSLPKSLLPITDVIPFSETIFLWQSIVVSVVLVSVSVVIAVWSAPGPDTAQTAEAMNIKVERDVTDDLPPPQQPGEWLEYSAVLGFFIPSGGGKWLLEAPYVIQATNDLKETPSGLGGPGLQRCGGVTEPHHSLLDAAAARLARPQGSRYCRLYIPAAARPPTAGALLALGLSLHAGISPAGDSLEGNP